MRKFKCIKSYESGKWLTKGKIYIEDNGKLRYDDGWVSHGWDYNVSHFGEDDAVSNYLEEVFDMEKFIKPTLDNDTMIEKLDGEYCSGRLCGDCIFSGNDCGWSDMTDEELLSAYNLAFGNKPTESSTIFTITTSDTITTLTDGSHTTSINRYYTDKHDDMVALEEVVNKYKSEMEEINKDKEIKEAIDKFIKDNNYDVEVEVKRRVVK